MKWNSCPRIEREKRTVALMIGIFCRAKHGCAGKRLCPECEELLAYACKHLERCPFGENKRSCRHCAIHCYSPSMRRRIQEVMRFSGPRMIFHAPLQALRHLISE